MNTLLLASRDHLQQLGWVSLLLTICLLEALQVRIVIIIEAWSPKNRTD